MAMPQRERWNLDLFHLAAVKIITSSILTVLPKKRCRTSLVLLNVIYAILLPHRLAMESLS